MEAQSYRDKLDAIMDTFSDLLVDDHKDALRSTIMSLKKLMVKHWWQMVEADMDVVLKSIHNPHCIYLHQHLTTKGVDVMEPATEELRAGPSSGSCPKRCERWRSGSSL